MRPGAAENLFPKAQKLRAIIDLCSTLAARRGQIVLGDDRERRAFTVRFDEGLLVEDTDSLIDLGPTHIEIVEGGVRECATQCWTTKLVNPRKLEPSAYVVIATLIGAPQ